MATVRKHELMIREFGLCEGRTCRECSNLTDEWHRGKRVRKCEVYGNTWSEATDWAGRWLACGMFNKPYAGRPIIEIVKRGKAKIPDVPLENQQTMWEAET